MRVFVTCVGRAGSVSFREACRPATNYRTGHESKSGLLEYPDGWIEVSPQIRKCIALLARKYPDAKWVHLIREPIGCVRSLARLGHGSVMRAYATLYPSVMPSDQLDDIAERFYACENDTIAAQLDRVPTAQRMEMHLETIREQWPRFWEWIGAVGDLEASLAAWDTIRNSGQERGEA